MGRAFANFRLIEGDIADYTTCEVACKGVDVVLHQAALGSVPRSIKDPVSTNRANVTSFLNMITAAKKVGVRRFVYASSSSVYGDSAELPKVESRTGNLLSPYAVTKRANELYASVFARNFGMEAIGLRYFNVFGRRQDPEGEYAAVIPRWTAALILPRKWRRWYTFLPAGEPLWAEWEEKKSNLSLMKESLSAFI